MTAHSRRSFGVRGLAFGGFAMVVLWLGETWAPSMAQAVPMTNDPGGFLEFPWGISLEGRGELSPQEGHGRRKEYELVRTPLQVGPVPVTTIRLVTIDGHFARAVVYYDGKEPHRSMLAALQQWFGELDLTPGQLAAGAQQEQHFNWRGEVTEINLTYDGKRERGVLFVESRQLASRFNEDIGGQ